jgi:hypothetical protein
MLKFKYAVFLSTFIVFFIEGLFHYNVGKNGLKTFKFPESYDLLKIILILTIFSMINAYISKMMFDYNK